MVPGLYVPDFALLVSERLVACGLFFAVAVEVMTRDGRPLHAVADLGCGSCAGGNHSAAFEDYDKEIHIVPKCAPMTQLRHKRTVPDWLAGPLTYGCEPARAALPTSICKSGHRW